jgi:hypothetical protein
MDENRFELNVSLPPDPRFAETARELAVQAARQGGCVEAEAQTFGRTVEGAIRRWLSTSAPGAQVPLVVRCLAGPVEVLVNGQTLTPEG